MLFKITEDRLGKKIVINKELAEGEIICRFTGKPIDYQKTLNLGDKESFALQVEKDVYLYLEEPYRYFNHSCEPNCGLNEKLDLIAIQNIAKNDELCYDYSTTMLEHHWNMQCECRRESCRNIIGDFDKIPKEIQQKYIRLNIVQPFILKQLNLFK
jgi:uncharacterized protein